MAVVIMLEWVLIVWFLDGAIYIEQGLTQAACDKEFQRDFYGVHAVACMTDEEFLRFAKGNFQKGEEETDDRGHTH